MGKPTSKAQVKGINPIFNSFIKALDNPLANSMDKGTIYDSVEFIDTGNYLYNAQLSGSIYGGISSNKIMIIAGDPATGKTFLLLGIIKNFLNKNENACVFLFETEGAITSDMLNEREVDTSRVILVPIGSAEDFKIQITKLVESIKNTKEKERPKFLFALDSIGMLASEKEESDALSGKTSADMTRAKTMKSLFRIITLSLASLNIPLIATNHIYQTIGSFIPMKTMGGGTAAYFSASSISFLSKAQAKEAGKLVGITVTSKLEKSRFTKERTVVKFDIDFMKGLTPYSGLLEWCVEQGLISENGKEFCWKGESSGMKDKEIKTSPEKFFTKQKLDTIVEPYVNSFFKFGGVSSENDEEQTPTSANSEE